VEMICGKSEFRLKEQASNGRWKP